MFFCHDSVLSWVYPHNACGSMLILVSYFSRIIHKTFARRLIRLELMPL